MLEISIFFLWKKEEDKVGRTHEGGDAAHGKFRGGCDGPRNGIGQQAEEGAEEEGEGKDGAVVVAENEADDVRDDESDEADHAATGHGGSNQ